MTEELNKIAKDVSHNSHIFSHEVFFNLRELATSKISTEKLKEMVSRCVGNFRRRKEQQKKYAYSWMKPAEEEKPRPSEQQILKFLRIVKDGNVGLAEQMIKAFHKQIVDSYDHVSSHSFEIIF